MTTKRLRVLLTLLRDGGAMKRASVAALERLGFLCPTCHGPTARCRYHGWNHDIDIRARCTCGWDDAREQAASEARADVNAILAAIAAHAERRRDTRSPIERMIDEATGRR